MQSSLSIAEILQDLKAAVSLLESAERAWPDALQAELLDGEAPEFSLIEDLLHSATHETASSLAMTVQEIEALLLRVRLRQRFAMFSTAQFERIVLQGWSTALSYELHKELPSMRLADLSGHIKQLCIEWGRLPPSAARKM